MRRISWIASVFMIATDADKGVTFASFLMLFTIADCLIDIAKHLDRAQEAKQDKESL